MFLVEKKISFSYYLTINVNNVTNEQKKSVSTIETLSFFLKRF